MECNNRDLAILARLDCPHCGGLGYGEFKRRGMLPCECALRNIFRACYARFRHCVQDARSLSRVNFERAPTGRSNRGSWGLKREEYMADFEIVARRTLSAPRYRLFRYHHILGASVLMCARRIGLPSTATHHAVDRIESSLGRAFATLQPYPLYPLSDYFKGRRAEPVKPCPLPVRSAQTVQPWLSIPQGRQRTGQQQVA